MNNEFLLSLNATLYLFAILYCIRSKINMIVMSILALYGISALGSVFLFNNIFFDEGKGIISFYPLLYLFLMLMLMLRPLAVIDTRKIKGISHPDEKTIEIFIIMIFVFALPRSIETFVNFHDVIGGLMADATSADLAEAESIYDKTSGGGLNVLSILGGCSFGLSSLFFMYYLTRQNKKKKYIVMLALVSIASVFDGSVKGNRGPLVFYSLEMGLLYLFFRPYYSHKINTLFKTVGGIFLIGVGSFFYLLSMHKHGLLKEDVISYKFLLYFSENFIIFDSYGLDANGIRYGTRTATIFTKFLFPGSPSTYVERTAYFKDMKLNESRFSTFVGDFTLDYGPIIAALIFVIFSNFFTKKLRISGMLPFNRIIILYFLICVFSAGLFLHPYCNLGGNLQILVYIFVYKYFSTKKYINGKSNSIISPPVPSGKGK